MCILIVRRTTLANVLRTGGLNASNSAKLSAEAVDTLLVYVVAYGTTWSNVFLLNRPNAWPFQIIWCSSLDDLQFSALFAAKWYIGVSTHNRFFGFNSDVLLVSSMKLVRGISALFVVLVLISAGYLWLTYFSGGSYHRTSWNLASPQEVQASLEADLAAHPKIPGALLYIDAPNLSSSGSYAAGFADPAENVLLTPEHVVRIASITKAYVAATALALFEQDRLDLDARLSRALAPSFVSKLEDDGYDTSGISLAHLLAHTSGIPDYATHPIYTLTNVSSDILGKTLIWTPESQVALAMDWSAPKADPGDQFIYSDTGYVLLGNAIERALGKPLHVVVRDTLDFDDLELNATYWEKLEVKPEDLTRAHQFHGRADLYGVDASIDLFGGGGLVASVSDTGRAIRAINTGAVFANSDTRFRMRENTLPSVTTYGLGWHKRTLMNQECWGHSGAWGLIALHCEDVDVTLVLSYHQANVTGLEHRAEQILTALLQDK